MVWQKICVTMQGNVNNRSQVTVELGPPCAIPMIQSIQSSNSKALYLTIALGLCQIDKIAEYMATAFWTSNKFVSTLKLAQHLNASFVKTQVGKFSFWPGSDKSVKWWTDEYRVNIPPSTWLDERILFPQGFPSLRSRFQRCFNNFKQLSLSIVGCDVACFSHPRLALHPSHSDLGGCDQCRWPPAYELLYKNYSLCWQLLLLSTRPVSHLSTIFPMLIIFKHLSAASLN